jgi:hypothetical protein
MVTQPGDSVLRQSHGIGASLLAYGLAHVGLPFALFRRLWPIPHWGQLYVATRYDDVREICLSDDVFPVPYAAKLDVIMDDQPFFLGMGNTELYRRDTAAMPCCSSGRRSHIIGASRVSVDSRQLCCVRARS